MHNFHHLMRDWMREVDAGRLSEVDATGRVAAFIHSKLHCTRVNFWSLEGEVGNRAMRRIAGYDGPTGQVVTAPLVLHETNGAFFAALLQDGCYVCADTSTDPRLAIIYGSYLQPTSAQAMLVAAFGVNGHTQGLISCVHAEPRKWLPAEITALRKCAAEVSLRQARRRENENPETRHN